MLMLAIVISLLLSQKNVEAYGVPFETPMAPNSINTNVYCGYHTDCVIDCRTAKENSYKGIPCAGARIDGSDAHSLTVICDNSNDADAGCKDTSITCPFDENSGDNTACNVQCINDNQQKVNKTGACQDTFISVYVNRNLGSLHVECSGSNACERMNVNCPSNGAHKCNIKCNSHKDEYGESDATCLNMHVSPISYDTTDNWLDLECDEGECDGLQFICMDMLDYSSNPISKTTDFVYNYGENEYECDDDECCPFGSANVTSLRSGLEEEHNHDKETMIVSLIVVSVLLVFMCFVSVFLFISLQKQKMRSNVDVGFVSLKDEA